MTAAIAAQNELKAITSSHIQANPYRWQFYVLSIVVAIGGILAGSYVMANESVFWGGVIQWVTVGIFVPLNIFGIMYACRSAHIRFFCNGDKNAITVEKLKNLGPSFAGSRTLLRQEKEQFCLCNFREHEARQIALNAQLRDLNQQTVLKCICVPVTDSIHLIGSHPYKSQKYQFSDGKVFEIFQTSSIVYFDNFNCFVGSPMYHLAATPKGSFQSSEEITNLYSSLMLLEKDNSDDIRDAVQFQNLNSIRSFVKADSPKANALRSQLVDRLLPLVKKAKQNNDKVAFVIHATLLPELLKRLGL